MSKTDATFLFRYKLAKLLSARMRTSILIACSGLTIILGCKSAVAQSEIKIKGATQENVTRKNNHDSGSLSKVDAILRKLDRRLRSLEAIQYQHTLELNYGSQNYNRSFTWDAYLDFELESPHLPRFQFVNEDLKYISNGSEMFYCENEGMTIAVDNEVSWETVSARYFINSLAALRTVLPAVIEDNTIGRSVKTAELNGQKVYEIELDFHKRHISHHGQLEPLGQAIDIHYNIVLDAESFLPIEVVRTDPKGDFMKATFAKIDSAPTKPEAASWYYSDYLSEYSLKEKDAEKQSIIGVSSEAPGWELPKYGSTETISLDDYGGELLLIEFWISHCGACIDSVATLNEIQSDFAGLGLKVIGLNPHDSNKTIRLFYENTKPNYPTVTKAKEVARSYGVSSFPTTFLVAKDGTIVYSGSLDKSKIRAKVREYLK